MLDRRPRVKSIYPVYKVKGDVFRVGAQLGITTQFRDPENQLWTMIGLMDGARSIPEVTDCMLQRYPHLSRQDVLDGIDRLDKAGLLEHGEDSDYDEERNPLHRYIGNVNYFTHFLRLTDSRSQFQDKLAAARVCLLGLGGAGSNILKLLVGLGVGEIRAVDYDRVEISNLNRQFFYSEADIGRLKTEAAARTVSQMNSCVKLETINQKLTSSDQIADLIRGSDLVISTIDEPHFLALRRVNRACVKERIKCLFGVMQITRGRVFSIDPFQSGCFDCLNVHYHKIDPLFVDQFRGFHESNFKHQHIAFGPDIYVLCGRMANEAARIITGHMEPFSFGKQVEIDFKTGKSYVLRTWPRYPEECPTCGSGTEDQWPAFSFYEEPL